MRPDIAPPATNTGTDEFVVVPSPNCPTGLFPQQAMEPLSNTAQVCPLPLDTETAVRPDIAPPATNTGTDEFVVVPSPNCPTGLFPQQAMDPLSNTAQVCQLPLDTETAVRPENAPPDTGTGIFDWLFPQHIIDVSARSAHDEPWPVVTTVA